MPPVVGVKMELRSFINLKTGEDHRLLYFRIVYDY